MTLSQILPTVARMHPARPALRMKGQCWTYAELLDQVASLAGALSAQGVQPGERVALLGAASPHLVIAELAAVAIGAIPFAIFNTLAQPEMQAIMADADPAVLVYSGALATVADRLEAPSLRLRLCCEEGGDHISLRKFSVDAVACPTYGAASPDATALLIYTGGTTGRAKGVMHTHRSISSFAGIIPQAGIGMAPAANILVANIAHITGQNSIWSTVAAGQCMLFPPMVPLNAAGIADLIEEERMPGVPLMGSLLRDLVNLPDLEQRDLSSLRALSHGGASTNPATLRRAVERFPQAVVIEGDAQTESGMAISGFNVSECVREGKRLERLASVAIPASKLPMTIIPMTMKIIDLTGEEAPAGVIGEVVCRGPQMMAGYWRNPEATAATVCNGWLHTGDLGYLDEEGYLFLVDRIKDMVIVGASNVYCAEVEKVLADHPAVAELCILGTPLPGEGEAVTAVVALNPNATFTLEDLRRHCAGKIADFKLPTRLEYVDALPRTPVSKINKAELRRMLNGAAED